MTNRVNMRLSLVMTAAALVTLAGGCDDRSTAADKAIHAQAREMSALSADGPAPAAKDVEQRTLAKVNTELTSATSSNVSGEKAAASMLVAQSNLNLAERAMGEVGAAEREAGLIVTELDGLLTKWRVHQAMRAAADSYDPSAEVAEIATRKQAKDGEIAKERANKAQLETKLNDLKTKAKEKMDAMAAREAEYGKLMEQAARLSATQGVSLVEQANGIRREADQLRMVGTKLEAQAAVIEPQVRESEAIINQLVNQKKDMESTEAALAQQASQKKAEAAEAAASANAAGVKITEAAGRLKAARDKVEVAYNSTQALYSKAVSAAREASRESPTSGKALLGDAFVGTGFMHWQRSQGLRAYTALLESLAKVQPPLSDRAAFESDAKNASEEAGKAITAAGEALEQASTQFDGVRSQGAAKERLTNLSEMLKSAMSASKDLSSTSSPELLKLAGIDAPPATMSATSSSGGSSSGSGGSAAAGGTPQATVSAILAAVKAGRIQDTFVYMDVKPEERPIMDAVKGMFAEMDRADRACRAKFGKSFSEIAGAMDMTKALSQSKQGQALMNATIDDLKFEENGDTTVVTGAALPEPMTLHKVNGQWLVRNDDSKGMAAGGAMMAQMMKVLTSTYSEFANEVEAGKYADAEAAKAGLMAKAAKLGPMGGFGGG